MLSTVNRSKPTFEREHSSSVPIASPDHPVESEPSALPEVSIFQYYSVENEVRDIERMRRAGVEESGVRAYAHENAVTFALEFAGMVPHTSIAYHLDSESGELQYVAGNGEHIRMRDSYEGLADKAGVGSREEEEYIGYSICEQALATGATSSVILSPPHDEAARFAQDGYGLVMAMMKDPSRKEDVRLHIFRYREPVGSLNRTNQIAKSLFENGLTTRGANDVSVRGRFETEQECRTNPYVGVLDADMEFAIVLQSVGITQAELRFSALYEQKLRLELDAYIKTYTDCAVAGKVEGAKDALSRYFNAAKDLKKQLEGVLAQETRAAEKPPTHIYAARPNGLVHDIDYDRQILEMQFIHANDTRYNGPATAQAGGSCPVSSGGRVMSGLTVDRGIAAGQTVESILGGRGIDTTDYKDDPNLCRCGNREPHFHCPNESCKYPIVVGEGTEQCPGCGKGKTC